MIKPDTQVGDDVHVAPYCSIGLAPRLSAATRRAFDPSLEPVRIGHRTVINPYVCIYINVHIGQDCMIGNHASIREGCRIGDRCVVGAYVDLQYGVTLGNDVRILNQTQITGGTKIGDNTFIGPGVQTANDPFLFHEDLDDYKDRGQVPPVIGSKVFVGAAAIILPGVQIGDGARVAAGSLVTRDVPAGGVVFGSPARPRQ